MFIYYTFLTWKAAYCISSERWNKVSVLASSRKLGGSRAGISAVAFENNFGAMDDIRPWQIGRLAGECCLSISYALHCAI